MCAWCADRTHAPRSYRRELELLEYVRRQAAEGAASDSDESGAGIFGDIASGLAGLVGYVRDGAGRATAR